MIRCKKYKLKSQFCSIFNSTIFNSIMYSFQHYGHSLLLSRSEAYKETQKPRIEKCAL